MAGSDSQRHSWFVTSCQIPKEGSFQSPPGLSWDVLGGGSCSCRVLLVQGLGFRASGSELGAQAVVNCGVWGVWFRGFRGLQDQNPRPQAPILFRER